MITPRKALLDGRMLTSMLMVLFLVALLSSPGCSKDEMKKMAATVKEKSTSIAESTKQMATQAVQQVEETVEETLPETGQLTLQVSPPVETESANIEVVSIGDGRTNVVQIANYDVGTGPKKYPTVLIQGNTTAGDPASLAGQTIACDLYMQASPSGPIAMTPIARKQPVDASLRNPVLYKTRI